MFVIVNKKSKALDIEAHEKMYKEAPRFYYNAETNEWAIEVFGKYEYENKPVETLGEGWECKS